MADIDVIDLAPSMCRQCRTRGYGRSVRAPSAAQDAEFVFLCVATPTDTDGRADLASVDEAIAGIAEVLPPGAVVVLKSTTPVGSARRVRGMLTEAGRADVHVAVNPEFLREGTAVREFLNPDRIVVGVESDAVAVRLSVLHQALRARIIVTDPASAEMIKYASNAYLATRISFVNSIAQLCKAVGADIADVVLGMGHDPRIGFAGLQAGPGFGGSCLPKDAAALMATARDAGLEFAQLAAAIEVNSEQRVRIVEKIRKAAGGTVEGTSIAVWGLTFKAGTDDVRESPAVDIVDRLVREGAVIRAFDPAADPDRVRARIEVDQVSDLYEACAGAEVLAVLTEWEHFRWADFDRVKQAMKGRAVVDARNVLDRQALLRRGFEYEGVGR